MAISEAQLTTWSHQGSITNSASTGNSVRTALEQYNGFPQGINYDIYLQGSYKNDTNIFGESDVDVTIELTSSFYNNLSAEQQKTLGFTDATYGYFDFRNDVENCLRQYFGTNYVQNGNKVFKIAPNGNRLDADVLVASSYRLYYNASTASAYHPGIAFYTRNEGSRIVNFPKSHSTNATTKHQNTSYWFKPTVRIFKNIRNYLVNNKGFNRALAPSYYIECMLSNVPNTQFGANYQTTTANCINYILQNDISNFKCLNGIRPLWGTTTENWNEIEARAYLNEIVKLWNS